MFKVKILKKPGYWTKEMCHAEALNHKTRLKFQKANPVAYQKARKYKWLDEICSHMESQIPSYSIDYCHKEALKYKSKTELNHKNSAIYAYSRKRNWLDQICSHMIIKKKPANYWNKERCHAEALKYTTRRDFQKYSISAYNASVKNGWLKEISSHLKYLHKIWTEEKCIEEALKFKTISDFKKNSAAYDYARSHGFLYKLTANMIDGRFKKTCHA